MALFGLVSKGMRSVASSAFMSLELKQSSGDCESKIKGSAGLVSPEVSPFALQMATFSWCPHVVFPPCASLVFLLPIIRTSVRLDEGHPQDLILPLSPL